jgi:hypothetical protein
MSRRVNAPRAQSLPARYLLALNTGHGTPQISQEEVALQQMADAAAQKQAAALARANALARAADRAQADRAIKNKRLGQEMSEFIAHSESEEELAIEERRRR